MIILIKILNWKKIREFLVKKPKPLTRRWKIFTEIMRWVQILILTFLVGLAYYFHIEVPQFSYPFLFFILASYWSYFIISTINDINIGEQNG